MDWIDTYCPSISLYHGRNWTDRGCTKVSPLCYALYLLSIPSHCTMGGTGQTGVVPKCPISHRLQGSSHPTVPWEGLDGQGLYQSVPFAMPCTYCPSHPTVPCEGLDGQGLYQSVPPLLCPVPTVHPVPLYHGRDWTDNGCTKVSPLLCPVPTVHPIPLYHGIEWMDRGCTKVSPLLCPVPIVHPIPLYHGRDWTDRGCTKVSLLLCPVPTVHPIPLYQIKIYRGSMPETPLVFHTLCPQIHTCPPKIHPISFCPPLGKKLKETLKDK